MYYLEFILQLRGVFFVCSVKHFGVVVFFSHKPSRDDRGPRGGWREQSFFSHP